MRKGLIVLGYIIFCSLWGIACGSSKNMEMVESIGAVEETTAENETIADEPKVLFPLPVTIDPANLDNCTVAVSFGEGDAYVDDTGIMQMDVTVYTYDLYDMLDIASLEEGDTIVIGGQNIQITSLERFEKGILINGGLENNGYELYTEDTGVWYERGYSDTKSYYEIGNTTLRVSADMIFYDCSDLDKGEVIYYPGDFLTKDAGIVYHFIPNNTNIVIRDGMIIEVRRSYVP